MEEEIQGDESAAPRNGVGRRKPLSASKSPEAGGEPGLLPAHPGDTEAAGWQLALPASEDLERILSEREDGDSLVDLEKAAASLLDLAKRQDIVQAKLCEVAEWHLRVKRKLGRVLMQTVSRGGGRARLHAATLLPGSLPFGIDKFAARRCRKLAEIDDSSFAEYLVQVQRRTRIPSAAGAIAFASRSERSPSPQKRGRKKTKPHFEEIEVSNHVIEAIERCLGSIDVCVGGAKVRCSRRVAGAKLTAADVQGTVLVTARVDAEVWLDKFIELKRGAQCEQVVVLLPVETSASWFRLFSRARWHLCFLSESREPALAAYTGKRSEAFFAAMHEHGVVLGSRQ